VRAFNIALNSEPNPTYSNICTAIHTAAERSLPLIRPAEVAQPIWMTDPAVRKVHLENLRRTRRKAEEAEKALATVYKEQQLTAITEAIKVVDSAVPGKKNSAAWAAINTLTGRKRRSQLNLSGDSPDERKNKARDFFADVLNAAPPQLPDRLQLPPGTPLPDSSCFSTGPVSPSEIVALAKLCPGGKATGPDDVPLEALRIPAVAQEVARIINDVLAGGAAPAEWTLAHIVAVPKKPGTTKVEEHRGISMLSCAAKLYNRLLLKRLLTVIDPFLRIEQNGFRPRRGTVTQILCLRRIIEETKIRQANIVCVFVDFHKAFDSVARGALPLVLRAYNVPEQLVAAVMALYHNTRAAVITPDGLTDPFSTTSGVLQGDTLAPFLFVLILDWVLRTSLPSDTDGFQLCRRTSSRHPEKRLAFLAYAEDLALLASDAEGAQRQLDSLATMASRVGLVINAKKTQVLTVPSSLRADVKLRSSAGGAITLPRTEQFQYLGGRVPNVREDLLHRKSLAWAAFRSVRVFLQSDALSDELKGRLFKALIESVLLYNAESWTLTEALERQLDGIYCCLLRAVFRLHYPDLTTNNAVLRRAKLILPSVTLKLRRLKMTGHVLRARQYCPEPLQDSLFLSLQGPFRRGQARTLRFPEQLLRDAEAPDQVSGETYVERLAAARTI
jgi:hypothetical protein